MLAADKLQLQSHLKQQATALKEKEFTLHHSNFMTVGTQAAVLAGLDITMFIEFAPAEDHEWGELEWVARVIKFFYYAVIVAAFGANMLVVSHTTALSVLGAGLALRGPDGSMMTAVEGLYEERTAVFQAFAVGLACTVGSVLLSVWLLLRWEAALICWLVAVYTCRKIYSSYVRVVHRFDYDESLTVDFKDMLDGPANIKGVRARKYNPKGNKQKSPNHNESSRYWNGSSRQETQKILTKNSHDHDDDEYEESYTDDTDLEMQQTEQRRKPVKRRMAKSDMVIQTV